MTEAELQGADLCDVCKEPIDPHGFYNRFRGNECRLFCSHACSVKEAVAFEREACAQAAESLRTPPLRCDSRGQPVEIPFQLADAIAAAIRARP